ncbi:glutamate--cysteine ligase [Haematobacter massiliensis]|uniref:Glutamate--cysteine ligase n=1 Tax=Haematobacter massiliensis TaxID=195105 RepID=A0A086YAR8_9RHOB|nr:glutamate--cysteine ligase [Haematobacter massiliensis]KFI31368.1 glutamate--cysteine ligase [Haematobacter massiliensis]OWJ73689.1 glutamate--cysteine ligase [Haematobacter massiliensis]OWJ84131.1 glutamate--cysteine ligase [Haematobacter massiliensis]QBJ23451.1 glutamate--cysteine ligase [Haematobacter massiliensis]
MSIPQSGGGPIENRAALADYLASGCKPASEWRIGTEHEKFGFLTDSHAPLPYDGERSIHALLKGLQRFGWAPVEEQGKLIGLSRDGASVSLEPGGQFELSGAPLATVHETAAETACHLAEVAAVTADMGVAFMGLGAAPEWSQNEMPVMPKGRYRLMTEYMGRVGTHGTQMMYRTSTVQVNLDFGSEADMVKKFRVSLALQPVATALFANSPFFDGRPNGHMSWRSRIWRDLDASRTGMLPFVFEEGFGFERYAEWVLDVPMYFVYRDGNYVDARGQSFGDFLDGRLPALPGETPTLSDWADHLTTVFPEVRIKKFMEMRGADAGDRAQLAALPAFWVGLLYDQGALDAAWDLVKGWDAATREDLRIAASVSALRGEANGVRLHDVAREALALAEGGLKARNRLDSEGRDETVFLATLRDRVASGKVPADRLLDLYDGEWGRDLSRIYASQRY